jgi:hypothetical protein
MAFSRDDLTAYESKPQVEDPNFDPWGGKSHPPEPQVKAEASPEPSTEDVTEPAEQVQDGSTTEPEAEPVAAEIAKPEGEKDPDLEDSEDGRPRSRAQERIEELVAERNALRKYGEYLLAQVESQRKAPMQAAPDSQPTQPPAQEDPAPTLESAEYDPIKLNKLQNEWIQRQVEKRVDSAVRQIESRQSEVAIRQAFEQKTVEFRKSAPDFDIVIANPALPSLAPEAAKVVIRSDNGPAIAYHLAKNPDLAIRISRMDVAGQSAAIGRLEEQLVRAKTEVINTQKEPSKVVPKPVSVTKAPPPPKPVSSGSAIVRKDENLMSMEEWVANERSKKIAEQAAKKKMRLAMR